MARQETGDQKTATVVDILSPAAMFNAYYICHNVQVRFIHQVLKHKYFLTIRCIKRLFISMSINRLGSEPLISLILLIENEN